LTHSLCGINFIVSSFCERFLFILSVFNSWFSHQPSIIDPK
jgi:hypothetical protein